MNSGYEFTIAGEASRFLFGSTSRIRRKAGDAFDFLARHPSTPGDFEERTPAGRVLQVKLFDDMIVTFWADHLRARNADHPLRNGGIIARMAM